MTFQLPERAVRGNPDGYMTVQRSLEALTLALGELLPITGISVTGSRGGNAALTSLLTALETTGIIVDNTTA